MWEAFFKSIIVSVGAFFFLQLIVPYTKNDSIFSKIFTALFYIGAFVFIVAVSVLWAFYVNFVCWFSTIYGREAGTLENVIFVLLYFAPILSGFIMWLNKNKTKDN